MTISDIYARLYNKTYYDITEQNKFRFMNNGLIIDRCAIIPFVIHMLDGIFYMHASQKIANENLFRLEVNEFDIKLYSTITGSPLWTLE